MVLLPVSVPSCHWILTVPCLCCEAPIDSLPRGQCPGSVLQEGPNGTASPSSFTAPGLSCTQCRSGENDRVFRSPGQGLLVPRISEFLREGHTASA